MLNQKKAIFLALMATGCIHRETPPMMVAITNEFAASAISRAVAKNAITGPVSGFGHYRGTQGFLAMEGSFTMTKDSELLRVTLHGPFGGVLTEEELPNQGAAALIFEGLPEGFADSISSARLQGNIIIAEVHLGYDTAQVAIDGGRVKSLSMWGYSFLLSDYRPTPNGQEFPYRIDYTGPDARATLVFQEVRPGLAPEN